MCKKTIIMLLAFNLCGCASCRHIEGRTRLSSAGSIHSIEIEKSTKDSATFRINGRQVRFFHHSRKMFFDGMMVWLSEPAHKRRKSLTLSTQDMRLTLLPLLSPEKFINQIKAENVFLDPGHGGADSGATVMGHRDEKDIVLDIAKSAASKLKKQGIPVSLARESDKSVGLKSRNAMAKKSNAGILVSIHLNAASNRSAEGIETFILPPAGAASTHGRQYGNAAPFPGNRFNTQNIILAHNVHSRLVRNMSATDRGIKRARFSILRNATCPAILVECGFLTNRNDATKLHNTKYIRKLGESLAEGIIDYINKMPGSHRFKQSESDADEVSQAVSINFLNSANR